MGLDYRFSARCIADQISNLASDLYELNKRAHELGAVDAAAQIDDWSIRAETIAEEIRAAYRKNEDTDDSTSEEEIEVSHDETCEPCGQGIWTDLGGGDEFLSCTAPAGHPGDHRSGEITWVRR